MKYRDIVCLAFSRKIGGKCIAGKDIETREWIRPVSVNQHGELEDKHVKYKNGGLPRLLDIIRVPYEKYSPLFYQPENILIDEEISWEKMGEYDDSCLDVLCDAPDIIWANEHYPHNKVSIQYLKGNPPSSSLLLIRPTWIEIKRVNTNDDELRTRALFAYNDVEYELSITDPEIEKRYERNVEGVYHLKSSIAYLCISLGEPYKKDNCCYKLVAGVIER